MIPSKKESGVEEIKFRQPVQREFELDPKVAQLEDTTEERYKIYFRIVGKIKFLISKCPVEGEGNFRDEIVKFLNEDYGNGLMKKVREDMTFVLQNFFKIQEDPIC